LVYLLKITSVDRFVSYFTLKDDGMYDKKTDFRAVARTSNLNEELGQIEYVFSDKTGTLTSNVMELQRISIRGTSYTIDAATRQLFESLNQTKASGDFHFIRQFLIHLSTCHTVMPERQEDGSIKYQAASPDERALVIASEKLGATFHTRKPKQIFVNLFGREEAFDILNVIEFDSDRKRMSVVVRDERGTVMLLCKGAVSHLLTRLLLFGLPLSDVVWLFDKDNVILPRLKKRLDSDQEEQTVVDTTLQDIENFAKLGLRTLVFAYKEIKKLDYEVTSGVAYFGAGFKSPTETGS
jgi:phospholipid-transporting ATPase